MKPFFFSALIFPFAAISQAAVTFTNTQVLNASTTIPDNNGTGFVSSQTITGGSGGTPDHDQITFITNVEVNLNFTGGWNGDLYVYLVHDTGFSVLLNRIGRDISTGTGPSPFGSGTSGMDITLSDAAFTNVHEISANDGSLTGTYQPDGRKIDPGLVTTGDTPTATLSNFNGLDATGEWTLFVADLGVGDQSTLISWSLHITAVPEPAVPLLMNAFAVVGLFRRCRQA